MEVQSLQLVLVEELTAKDIRMLVAGFQILLCRLWDTQTDRVTVVVDEQGAGQEVVVPSHLNGGDGEGNGLDKVKEKEIFIVKLSLKDSSCRSPTLAALIRIGD